LRLLDGTKYSVSYLCNNYNIKLMKRIRIGNNINVSISIYNNGMAYDLTGKTVKTYLISPVSKSEVVPSINSNNISFIFSGSDQKICGKYNVAVEILSGSNKNTVDSIDGFKLVDRTCKIGGENGELNIESLVVSLEI